MSFIKSFAGLAVASVAIATIGGAYAADYNFYADKSGWPEPLAKVASEATGDNVKPQVVLPTDKYQAFIQTSIAGNNTPPLFTWWNGKQLEDIVSTGVAADLSTYWDTAIKNGNYSAAQRDLVSVDGKPYGILLNVANWVVLYNTKAFDEAGISAPPKTWDELMADADKLKAAGYTPFNAPASGGWMPFIWFSQLVLGNDPDAFVGLTDGKTPYNGPVVQKAFQMWGDMYKKGYFTDPREQDAEKNFENGTGAMFLIGDWDVGGIAKKGMKPGVDFKSFLMPSVSPDVPQSVIVEASPIVVSKQTLDSNPAFGKVIDSLMSADASNALSASAGVFNGNLKGKAPDPIVQADSEMVAAQNPRNLVRWWEAVPPQIQGDLVAEMGAFMFNPTPDQAKQSMDNMQSINADYWASK